MQSTLKYITVLLCITLSAGVLHAQSKQETFRAGDNTLFATPTGETIPKGMHQLSSFQLLFIGYNYGITDRLQVGAFSFFPLSAEIFRQSLSIGAKYEVVRNGPFSVAGSAVVLPVNQVGLGLVTGTYRLDQLRLHGGFGTGLNFEDMDNSGLVVMFGADQSISNRTSLMGEFLSVGGGVFDDASGVYTVGFRFIRGDVNVDIGGMRPLGVSGDFLFFPFVKAALEL